MINVSLIDSNSVVRKVIVVATNTTIAPEDLPIWLDGNFYAGDGGDICYTVFGTPATGGSGIVVLRYLGAQRGTGGSYIYSGGYSYHYFYTSGSYTA